jgi:hypothetical protein
VRGSLAGLVAAQFLYLGIGAGLMPLLRIVSTSAQLVPRLGLAYMVGVAATGILAAHLALLDVPLGLLELSLLAAVSLALGGRRLRRLERGSIRTTRPGRLELAGAVVAGAAALTTLVLLVHAARAFAVRPLKEWDGWAIWGLKARALYEFGGTYGPVFTTYQPVAHPILLPALEATAFRAMGAYDATRIHVQLIALAFGFALALWGLVGDRVPLVFTALTLLALFSAPAVLEQLSTNLADIPLAFLIGLGVASLARYVLDGEGWTLVCAALFLGAAMLTKSEGLLFFAAAVLACAAVLAVGRADRLPRLALAAGAALAILAPWRIYLAAHDLRNPEYSLSDLLRPGYLADHADRVSPTVSELWSQIWSSGWALLAPLALAAVWAAILAARYRVAAFALAWPVLAFLGLTAIYWISVVPIKLTLTWTADRIVASLVVGSVALVPLLAGEAWRVVSAEAAGRP